MKENSNLEGKGWLEITAMNSLLPTILFTTCWILCFTLHVRGFIKKNISSVRICNVYIYFVCEYFFSYGSLAEVTSSLQYVTSWLFEFSYFPLMNIKYLKK